MRISKLALVTGLLGLSMGLGMAGAAVADTAVGLVGEKTLLLIDGSKPATTRMMEVVGVERLLGIDVRPANRQLYGVAADGAVVTIDLESGKATKVSTLDKMIPATASAIVDFNPVADRLRFMGSDGTNLRADVDTGKVVTDGTLAFEKTDMHAAEKPNVVAAAYTNSTGKPTKTAMFDIDATIGALIQQTKPNDGTLKAIGKLGITAAKHYAFDVQSTAEDQNVAWLVADNKLYTVDLASGAARMRGEIVGAKGMIRDIAVLPRS